MQHVCVWEATEDERFQVCGDVECPMWRWSPSYSDRAATEAHRRVEVAPRSTVGKRGPQTGDSEGAA